MTEQQPNSSPPAEEPMRAAEVAVLFGVAPKTVMRWAASGRLGDAVFRTPGGHRRYRAARIRELLEATS